MVLNVEALAAELVVNVVIIVHFKSFRIVFVGLTRFLREFGTVKDIGKRDPTKPSIEASHRIINC